MGGGAGPAHWTKIIVCSARKEIANRCISKEAYYITNRTSVKRASGRRCFGERRYQDSGHFEA